MATPVPNPPDSGATFQKRIVRTLRFLLILAVLGAAFPAARSGDLSWRFWLAGGLLFASNIAYHLERAEVFAKLRVSALLFLFDTALLAYMMYELGERSRDFFLMFALTVLIAANGRGVGGAFVSTLAVVVLYTVLTAYGKTGVALSSPTFFTRTALFFVLSIFIGTLAHQAELARGAARQSTQLYRRLLDASPMYILLCDPAGRILAVNRAAESALGYAEGELRGRALADVTDLPIPWRAGPDVPAREDRVESLSLTLRRKDGTAFRAQATLGIVSAAEGPFLQVLAYEEARA